MEEMEEGEVRSDPNREEEIEEGEVRSNPNREEEEEGKKNEENITIAESYIDGRVTDLLGHLQGYFQGYHISKRKLGAMFGDYGSFLLPPPPRPTAEYDYSPPSLFDFYSSFSSSKLVPHLLSPASKSCYHLEGEKNPEIARVVRCHKKHGDLSAGSKDISRGNSKPSSLPIIGRKRPFCTGEPPTTGNKIRKVDLGSRNQSAATVIKEGRDLKNIAERLKEKGSMPESVDMYFQAALKLFTGAFLLEGGKVGWTCKLLYIETAQICEVCALEYEKIGEMAAASLAYKCIEVAYLRILYAQHSAAAARKDCSNPRHAAAHNPPNAMAKLTDYAYSAMDASRKSLNAFAFASAKQSAQEEDATDEGIEAVRKTLDFHFHDIEGLLHLIRQSLEFFER